MLIFKTIHDVKHVCTQWKNWYFYSNYRVNTNVNPSQLSSALQWLKTKGFGMSKPVHLHQMIKPCNRYTKIGGFICRNDLQHNLNAHINDTHASILRLSGSIEEHYRPIFLLLAPAFSHVIRDPMLQVCCDTAASWQHCVTHQWDLK